jgi:hypothetical protein
MERTVRRIVIVLAAVVSMGSTLACCITTNAPDININIRVPTFEIGALQEKQETIPLDDAESASVEVAFGAGELGIEAGDADELLSGQFSYNVEAWEPEISYDDGSLVIQQGSIGERWGIPVDEGARNEWELAFSPEIPLDMKLQVGAGEGDLDFTGLQLEELDMELGAGNFSVRFDEPNEVEMRDLNLDTGASELAVVGVGHASPRRMTVREGVGDIALDLTGAWARSADVEITAGVGELTLHLPDDVGVQVKIEGGVANVETVGLWRFEDAYVNDAYGETEIELDIAVTTGIGQVSLIEVSNN